MLHLGNSVKNYLGQTVYINFRNRPGKSAPVVVDDVTVGVLFDFCFVGFCWFFGGVFFFFFFGGGIRF